MKSSQEESESLKKVLKGPTTFDEANYYRSKTVELGGDDVLEDINEDPEDEDEDEVEDHEFYGDD